jgi:uncharacterized protein YbaP (TraB family)
MSKKKSDKSQHLLWKVHVKGGTWVNYIFGTMHTRDERVHAFLPHLMPYVQDCKVLATEFHLPDPEHFPAVVFDSVPDWWEPLTAKQKKKINILLASYNIGGIEQYTVSPPLMLMQAVTAEILGKEAAIPLDLELALQAKSAGLRLDGIETLEEQMGILHQIPIEKQVGQLVALSKDVRKYTRNLKNQVRWYLKQDIRQLYNDSRKQLKALRKLLLLRRNRLMADRMAIMCGNEPHFMAIGAAHLWGDKGVLNYMRHAGFKITPVPLHVK